MTVISGVILMVFAFASGIFSSKFGRKSILIYGELSLIVILVATGVVSLLTKDQVAEKNVSTTVTILIVGLIFLFEVVFSLTLGPLTWVYNAEILNSEKALGFATSLNWVSAFIIGLVFPVL